MARAVLDASAVIAILRNEPGAATVAAYAGDALISAVNVQEVAKALLVRGIALDILRQMIASLRLEVRSHGLDDAYGAASLYEATRSRGSGLGDRTCMALAISTGLPAITTDRAWGELAISGLNVTLVR